MKVHGLPLTSFLLLLVGQTTLAVKKEDFKTCSQSGFCRRGRALASRAREAETWNSPYSIDPTSIAIHENEASVTAAVRSALYPDVKFGLDVRIQEDGVVRVRMDEVGGLRKRYDEAARWALAEEPTINKEIRWWTGQKDLKAQYGGDVEVVVEYEPLRVVLYRGGVEQVVINGRGLLHMEHFRVKEEEVAAQEGEDGQEVLSVKPTAWFEGDVQDALWEETFSKWTDSKPKGRSSISLC